MNELHSEIKPKSKNLSQKLLLTKTPQTPNQPPLPRWPSLTTFQPFLPITHSLEWQLQTRSLHHLARQGKHLQVHFQAPFYRAWPHSREYWFRWYCRIYNFGLSLILLKTLQSLKFLHLPQVESCRTISQGRKRTKRWSQAILVQ